VSEQMTEIVWQSLNQVDDTPILSDVYDFWKNNEEPNTLTIRQNKDGAVGKTFKLTITEVTE